MWENNIPAWPQLTPYRWSNYGERMSSEEARKTRAYGYLQAAGLYPWRTIGKNIRLPLKSWE